MSTATFTTRSDLFGSKLILWGVAAVLLGLGKGCENTFSTQNENKIQITNKKPTSDKTSVQKREFVFPK